MITNVPFRWEILITGEATRMGEQRYMGNLFTMPSICSKPKTALKNKFDKNQQTVNFISIKVRKHKKIQSQEIQNPTSILQEFREQKKDEKEMKKSHG